MAQIINASELTKEIILDSELLRDTTVNYISTHIDFPLSSMSMSYSSYASPTGSSYQILQNMLYLAHLGEDPFSVFKVKDTHNHSYSIDTLIQYYRDHPRNFGFVARKTSTARAETIGNAIDIGEVASALKAKITNILHNFNTLFVDDLYANRNFWENQDNNPEQLIMADIITGEGRCGIYYPYNTYMPVFKFEKDLADLFYQTEVQGCCEILTNPLRKIVNYFGNIDPRNTVLTHEKTCLVNITDDSQTFSADKYYRALTFAKEQANNVIFNSICLYISFLIDIFLNTIIINGALRDQRKERNRLTTKKTLLRLSSLALSNEPDRHSSQMLLLTTLFAGCTINKETIYSNLTNIIQVLKEAFSIPNIVSQIFDASIITKIKNVAIWKPYFIKLEKDRLEIENILHTILDAESYLYKKFFAESNIEKSIQEAVKDTTTPIIKIIPTVISPIFKDLTVNDLDEVLFEKLVMAPLSFIQKRYFPNNSMARGYIDFNFGYNDSTINTIYRLQENTTSIINKNFIDTFLDTEAKSHLENIHGENLCASSLDNKRLYFLTSSRYSNENNKGFMSGIYTQYITTKESLGIILTYFIYILNHGTRSADGNYYRVAHRCPADITIYIEDK